MLSKLLLLNSYELERYLLLLLSTFSSLTLLCELKFRKKFFFEYLCRDGYWNLKFVRRQKM